MEYVTLNNGVKMPILGYGVYQVSNEECERCVLDAISVGYRSIDTAQAYGNEEAVGNAIRKCGLPREELFITTKVWISNGGYEKARASLRESLAKLQTEYIDLVLIHQPFNDYYGTWRAMEEACREGWIRAIGVSNFYPASVIPEILRRYKTMKQSHKLCSSILTGALLISLLAGCGSNNGSTASELSGNNSTEMKGNPMKRVIGCILAITMLLTMTACGQQAQQLSQSSDTSRNESAKDTFQPEETGSGTNGGSGKTLVVYFSATGNTETVAGYIADTLGADTFEIVPAEPYTSEDLNWTNENSRVCREHEESALRAMELQASSADDWDSYDTVFIGYPIWWGIAAWPVDSFIAANDFTGKTVIPFCTSSSSDLGESGKLLAEMAGTGDWLDGQRFRSSVSEADVVEWVNSLEF